MVQQIYLRIVIILYLYLSTVIGYIIGQDTMTVGNFPPAAKTPIVQAIKTNGPINVDGKLDEDVWKIAPIKKSKFYRR